MLKQFINNYFGFNRQQRNGLLILCTICFVLLLIRLNLNHFVGDSKITLSRLPDLVKTDSSTVDSSGTSVTLKKSLFAFNPNTADKTTLVSLGLPEKTAQTLIKFRSKGFVFKKKEDLKKVYGISDDLYQRLAPYVHIVTEKQTETPAIPSLKKQELLELNTADSVSLIALKGIGPSFAKRILKYRSVLGGYHHIEQLREVYGMNDETFTQLTSQTKIDPSLISKIRINEDDFKIINRHPYISYEITKEIFNARKTTTITATILQEILNDETVYIKLLPYIQF